MLYHTLGYNAFVQLLPSFSLLPGGWPTTSFSFLSFFMWAVLSVPTVSLLDTCNICAGHPEENFIKMAESRKGKLLTRNGERVVALVDTLPLVIEGKVFDKTIRSCACELVIKEKKCSACVSFRGTLRKSYHRWIKQKSLSPQHHVSTFTKTNLVLLRRKSVIRT